MSERIITLPEIREILPCQNGFLFLDRVQKLDEDHYVALKAVTITEPHFVGHFPAHPIMPGVLQVEAMAQLAEIAVWERLDPERKYDLYIKSISKVKFRKPNEPGDRMLIDVKVTAITTEEATIVATVTNNSGLACQGELVMGIREKITEIAMPALFNEFDKTTEIALNVDQVMQYIPHRFPFLFVDYVAKIDGCHFTGVKNGTASDPAFRIYKDGYSVLSGSVHPEIVAQAGKLGAVTISTNMAGRGTDILLGGNPEFMAKAKEEKTNAMRILESAGIPFEILSYTVDESDLSGVHVAKELNLPAEQVFKTLVTKGSKNGYAVFVIPVAEELDLKKCALAAGDKRVEMIPMKELLPLTGYIRGGCSPVGMKKPFPTYFDETATLFDRIYLSAGVRGKQFCLDPMALCDFLGAEFADLTF